MPDIPGPGDRVELLRKLGLADPASQPQRPLVIESSSGVILIGDNNTVHVFVRPTAAKKPVKPGT